jgi:hypothetical protein
MLAHVLWLAAIIAGLTCAWPLVRTGRLRVLVTANAVTSGTLGVWVVSHETLCVLVSRIRYRLL